MGPWARRARAAQAVGFCVLAAACGIEPRPRDAVIDDGRAATERARAPSSVAAASGDGEAKDRRRADAPPDARATSRLAEDLAPLPPMPPAGEQLSEGDVRVDLYPPGDPELERAPLVAYLHGACGDPRDCGWIQGAGRGKSFLACAAGNARCGDGFNWVGSTEERVATVDAALAAVDKALGARVNHARGDVRSATREAHTSRAICSPSDPDSFAASSTSGPRSARRRRARAAGIRRVVLACGDFDGAAKQMRSTAAVLTAKGVPARFLSFGRMGHGWPNDIDAILTRAIAWIREDPSFGS